ncbi:hypothetical protein NFI96_027121, partial [Prochilodus magdalenae]
MLVLWMMININGCLAEDTFSLLVPDGFISARIGSSVVLPCGLSTALDIKSYEVNWHRPNKKENPVLLYKALQVQENTGDPQYRGRASLIGELETGNVSLKLENLTLADRGEYVCLVKSPEWYDRAIVNLNITVVGSPPLLALAKGGEEVNVTCVSDGWSPNPTLIWRDKRGKEHRTTVDHHTNSKGLVSVSSWLLVSPSESEWISCSVGLSDQEMKEGRVLLLKPASKLDSVYDPDSSEPGLSPGWKAFTILLVISLLVFTVMAMFFIPKIRGRILPKDLKPASTGEPSPPPYPVSALREISRTDGAIHTPAMLVLWMMFNINGCSAEGTFSLLVPDGFISARIGSSVVLPCGLSTTLDIRSYEVNWHRPNKKENPVLLYKDQMVQESAGDPQYRGRVSLIGELENGNVSLKLENLTLADRGEYVCLVKSTEWYEKASLNLIITVVGSPPLLSLAESGEVVNVTCVSDGWSPNPTLIWRDKRGNQLRKTVNHNTDSEGLVSVSSWLIFFPAESEWISCFVGLPDQEMKEGRVLPLKPAYKPDPVCDPDPTLEPGLSPGWKAFTIVLVISLLVFTVMAMLFFPKIRGHILPKESKPASTGFQKKMIRKPSQKKKQKSQTGKKMVSCKGTFSLLVPDGYISARIGSSVVLPCGLSTTLDIKSYEVNWHRPNKKEDPVLLYKDQMVQENTGDPQYRGRVSLIGELENGNVSLKVENLTLADRGEYVCLVKSTEWYERASVNLNITVVGSPPLLSLAESGEEVNVTCVADGWSPNPILIWRDKKGKELRATVDHNTNSVGLVSVSSWLLVSPSGSEWISCSVGLSDQEMKEGRVLPPKMAYNPDSVNDPDSLEPGLSSGWKAFTILLVISLLVFTVMAMLFIPKIRGRILPKESKPASTDQVRRQLRRLHPRKAAGPDKVCPRMLKACAAQLGEPLQHVFNLSPKVHHAEDPLQFAYREKVGVEDAILYLLHRAHSHLDKGGCAVRVMFFDFSSAFNTIQPLLLRDKLMKMEVDMHLVTWITDYFTGRPQHVRIRDCSCDTVISSTGAPQGTVLSPVLFTLYTSDFKYNSELCHMQKFSDDTAIVGRSRPSQQPISIKGVDVEVVRSYRYLGVHLDERLDWSVNTDIVYKKAQSRLYFLRRLGSFGICQKLLLMFYQSVVASVLFYAVVCWGGSISKRDAGRLDRLEMKEGRVLALKPAYKPDSVNDPDSTLEPGLSSGWKAFTILLVICLLVLTVMGMLPKIR